MAMEKDKRRKGSEREGTRVDIYRVRLVGGSGGERRRGGR